MEYRIIRSEDIYSLENKVNEELEKGWKLQGGVCVTRDYETTMIEREDFYQAIIK